VLTPGDLVTCWVKRGAIVWRDHLDLSDEENYEPNTISAEVEICTLTQHDVALYIFDHDGEALVVTHLGMIGWVNLSRIEKVK